MKEEKGEMSVCMREKEREREREREKGGRMREEGNLNDLE